MKKKRILIVEDEADILTLTKVRLMKNGYDIESADNGNTGLEMIRKTAPDLVLLDLMLPALSGTEICKIIRQDPELCDIPVIIFTASGNTKTAQNTVVLGADDYIIKPFEPRELLNKIETVMNGKVVA